MTRAPGRHLLQIPGPTNVPLPVLAAMAQPTIDHRGPEFARLALSVLTDIRAVFQTEQPVVIYPASGTGAWEAALVNTLSPGDHILTYETGWFAKLWANLAERLGLVPEILPGDWRTSVDSAVVEARLAEDRSHAIKAVCIVHNETSTGVVSDVAAVRAALDRVNHPALLLVDTVSSLGSIDYRHDAWGVDVTIAGSQKGLMLPPGLCFNAVSKKALAASKAARLPRAFWNWDEMLVANKNGFFPYTPATNLLQGLRVALDLMLEEGLPSIFARHERAAEATRTCVRSWGLEINCTDPQACSATLTAVRVPDGWSADRLREQALLHGNMSLGNGLGKLADVVFRIGHLGDFSDASVMAVLSVIEMSMCSIEMPYRPGGLQTALASLAKRWRVPVASIA